MFHWFKKHNADGCETPDDTPIEVPLTTKPLTLAEQIRRFTINSEVQARLQERRMDSFDEADDFEVEETDNDELKSPYEDQFHGSAIPFQGLQARLDEQKSGMVEEMPMDRQERAQARLNAKPKAQPAESPVQKIQGEINKS